MESTGHPDYPYRCGECQDWLTADEAHNHACSSARVPTWVGRYREVDPA